MYQSKGAARYCTTSSRLAPAIYCGGGAWFPINLAEPTARAESARTFASESLRAAIKLDVARLRRRDRDALRGGRPHHLTWMTAAKGSHHPTNPCTSHVTWRGAQMHVELLSGQQVEQNATEQRGARANVRVSGSVELLRRRVHVLH